MKLSPNGEYLALASFKVIHIYSMKTYKYIEEIRTHEHHIFCLAFNNKGLLASGSYDCTINLFDAKRFSFIRRLGSDRDHINTIDFHPELPYLASGNEKGHVVVWDYKTDEKLKTLKDFKDSITEVKFSDT